MRNSKSQAVHYLADSVLKVGTEIDVLLNIPKTDFFTLFDR